MSASSSCAAYAATSSPGPETTQVPGPLTAAIDRPSGRGAAHLVLVQADGEHRAGRHALHQPAAGGDQAQRVGQREDAGEAGGHVLADAVADHRGRLDPPRAPQAGQRVLDGEQRGLGERGLAQPLVRGLALVLGGEEQVAQVEAELAAQELGALVDGRGEGRLGARRARRPCPRTARPGRRTGTPPGACRGLALQQAPRSRASAATASAASAATTARAVRRTAAGRPAGCRRRRRGRSPRSAARCAASRGHGGVQRGGRAGGERAAAGPGGAARAAAGAGGASSRTTCALVPPMPKELTPARRGPPSVSHSVSGVGDVERAGRRSRCAGSAARS